MADPPFIYNWTYQSEVFGTVSFTVDLCVSVFGRCPAICRQSVLPFELCLLFIAALALDLPISI